MKGVTTVILITFIITAITNCNSNNASQTYEYIPLKEYRFDSADIQPGNEVRILAFSGGAQSSNDTVYYYQFIVFDHRSRDTLRILTPLISFDSTSAEDKMYAIPFIFDEKKKVSDAFYELMGNNEDWILETAVRNVENKTDTADLTELVVINKNNAVFKNPKYKTATGVLNFKKRPW